MGERFNHKNISIRVDATKTFINALKFKADHRFS